MLRSSTLETRTARLRLKPGLTFRLIEPGLFLGYRRLTSGPGTWCVRRYVGSKTDSLVNITTADGKPIVADDYADAHGATVCSFAQAQDKAHELRPESHDAPEGPYTIADAMAAY